MAEFYHGSELNVELEKIFENAQDHLILISPFIRLHNRLKTILNRKKDDYELEIIIVYGKNEGVEHKSLSQEEFEFFKEFPNIEINYNPYLHAKYYANEDYALLSSMNLYDYSQNNNIEFGVLTRSKSILENIKTRVFGSGPSLDDDAFYFFQDVIEDSEVRFKRVPIIEGGQANGNAVSTKIEIDMLSDTYTKPKINKTISIKPEDKKTGYCIRTGEEIPFNPKQPMSKEAYNTWKKFGNESYPEKYCHKTGKPSNGKTNMKNPILE